MIETIKKLNEIRNEFDIEKLDDIIIELMTRSDKFKTESRIFKNV